MKTNKDYILQDFSRLREKKHFSLGYVSQETHISKATLSRIEKGQIQPSEKTLTSLGCFIYTSIRRDL